MIPSLSAESDVVTSLKVPPHSLTLEQAILSGLMADPGAWDNVTEIVSEKDFYSPRHTLIFRAIATLINNDQPCDAILVMKWLEDMQLLEKAGGEAYLGQILKDSPATTANIEAYSERVREFSVLRQLITASGEIANVAYQPKGQSATTILDQAETKIFAIAEQQKTATPRAGRN